MKRLLIDIETAPTLAAIWSAKPRYVSPDHIVQDGHVLCWAAKWYGKKQPIFRSLKKHGKEKMLYDAWQLLSEADAVIHYNGRKFDVPTLNGEFICEIGPPPAPYDEIDLLATSRRKFRVYSHSLNSWAQRLGIGEKLDHKGMPLWFGCMAGKAADWRTMEEYNKKDVFLLEQLYDRFLPWIVGHPNMGLYVDTDNPACIHCGSTNIERRGTRKTKTQVYPRYYCNDCNTWQRGRKNITDPERRPHVLVAA